MKRCLLGEQSITSSTGEEETPCGITVSHVEHEQAGGSGKEWATRIAQPEERGCWRDALFCTGRDEQT